MSIWPREQVQTFLTATEKDRLGPLYLLALTTGMRRGELAGLRWVDVDLDKGKLTVAQTLIEIEYRIEFSEPKTDRSRRTIRLDQATVAALRAHRKRQIEEKLILGPAWKDSGLVFTREDGSPIHPQAISNSFERAVKLLRLPRLTFHGLRHTYATLALESGMRPWDLSDRLGHSSVAFTLQVYRHAVQSTQDSAAEAAAAFILGR
jgi:integrase